MLDTLRANAPLHPDPANADSKLMADHRRRPPGQIASDRQAILAYVGRKTTRQEPWMRTSDVLALEAEGKLERTVQSERVHQRGFKGGVAVHKFTMLRRRTSSGKSDSVKL